MVVKAFSFAKPLPELERSSNFMLISGVELYYCI